jgi:hypothetical protein
MSSFTITSVVRQAVEHRLEMLDRTKKSFEGRCLSNTDQSDEPNVVKRIEKLLEHVKELDEKLDEEDGAWLLEAIERCIEQTQDDNTISEQKLLKMEKRLREKLSRFRNRMEVSCLHAQLIKEATEARTIGTATTKLETAVSDEDDFDLVDKEREEFDVVDKEREEALEKFTTACSQPTNVDSHAIETYLSSLFASDDEHLQSIRDGMRAYGDDMISGEVCVDKDRLTWIMTDLMKSDKITQERKETLGNYLQSPDALQQLVATLNMMSHHDWNYRNAEAGLPSDLRKTYGGQYYVHVEVDIVDMLFLHCCAIGWAMKLEKCLRDFVQVSDMFRCTPLTEADLDKLSFFLDSPRFLPPTGMTCDAYQSPPPPPIPHVCYQMLPPLPPSRIKKSGRSKKKDQTRYTGIPMPMNIPAPPPPKALPNVNNTRKEDYEEHFFMSRLPRRDGDEPKMVSRQEVQARLIKTLAVECKLRKAFDGKAHTSTMEFESVASTLPHDTVIAVLRFLGVPDLFIGFFTRALSPTLNIKASADEPNNNPTPKSGVLIGHGLEMLFSEAVSFFLEAAIRKATESYMYRLYDHCYFVGTEIQTKNAEHEAQRFSEIMGLKLRDTSPSSGLSIGLLTMGSRGSFSPSTSDEFCVDDVKVALYATDVGARLKACPTVIEWVREWNETVGTYAAHLFGPLANVFDTTHREAVKAAYKRMHSVVLGGSDLTTYVTKMLHPHLAGGLERVSLDLEPIIYLPQAYGGLGVKSAFVTLAFASRGGKSGSERIEEYLKEEATYYTQAADRYTRASDAQRQQRLETIFNNDISRMLSALGTEGSSTLCLATVPFMTESEMTEHRERARYPVPVPQYWMQTPPIIRDLARLYRDLLDEPTDDMEENRKTERDVRRLTRTRSLGPWYRMSDEDRWFLQLYSDECFERYGGLEIWWAEGMPVDVYNSIRGYNSDDEDDDDWNSIV